MVNVHSVQVVVCGQFAEYKLHCCLPRAPRVYSFRINHCMLVFYHFACAMGYCDWSSDKGLCSEFVHVGCGVIK